MTSLFSKRRAARPKPDYETPSMAEILRRYQHLSSKQDSTEQLEETERVKLKEILPSYRESQKQEKKDPPPKYAIVPDLEVLNDIYEGISIEDRMLFGGTGLQNDIEFGIKHADKLETRSIYFKIVVLRLLSGRSNESVGTRFCPSCRSNLELTLDVLFSRKRNDSRLSLRMNNLRRWLFYYTCHLAYVRYKTFETTDRLFGPVQYDHKLLEFIAKEGDSLRFKANLYPKELKLSRVFHLTMRRFLQNTSNHGWTITGNIRQMCLMDDDQFGRLYPNLVDIRKDYFRNLSYFYLYLERIGLYSRSL